MNTEKGPFLEQKLDLSPVGFLIARLYFEETDLVRIELIEGKEGAYSTCSNGKSASREAAPLTRLLSGMTLEKFPLAYKLKGTPFQRHIWRTTQEIPPGTTLTYGELARAAGCKSARAVGQALGRNPLPIIVPCHRVIGRNGRLTGFSAGLRVKEMLLEFERIKKDEDSHNE